MLNPYKLNVLSFGLHIAALPALLVQAETLDIDHKCCMIG